MVNWNRRLLVQGVTTVLWYLFIHWGTVLVIGVKCRGSQGAKSQVAKAKARQCCWDETLSLHSPFRLQMTGVVWACRARQQTHMRCPESNLAHVILATHIGTNRIVQMYEYRENTLRSSLCMVLMCTPCCSACLTWHHTWDSRFYRGCQGGGVGVWEHIYQNK